jgi:hypothetical protein
MKNSKELRAKSIEIRAKTSSRGLKLFALARLWRAGSLLSALSFLLLYALCFAVVCWAEPITKTSTEIIPQYHEFMRTDGNGWLAANETIGTQATDYTVKCYERDTLTETSSTMISNVAVADGNATRSRVTWKINAGTAGKSYLIKITINTSAGYTFEDWVYLAVK